MREALSAFMERRYSLSYDPKDIFVTVGGSEAIDLAIRMLVEDGDEVIIPQPCYVSYEPITTLTGGVPVTIQTKEEDEFRVTARQIKEAITEKTKLLILSFPNNPTGAVLRRQDLLEIADVIRDTDIIVLADEIYAELVYGEQGFTSIAQIDGMKERTIVVNGFSKKLEINGVGYKVEKSGKKITLSLGYSHPVYFEEADGITYEIPDANTIIVHGIDKQAVGQAAAQIREKRPPEPYLGKGIKYADEHIRRKAGKTGK